MTNPDKAPDTVPIQDLEKTDKNPENQIQNDMNKVEEGRGRVGEILEGEGGSKADEIREESMENVNKGRECSSDFEKEKLEKEYEEICKKINKNEELSEEEEKMLKEIGIGVGDIINEDTEFTVWRNKEKKDKEDAIEKKNIEFKKAFEFKKDKKEIKEAGEEITEKKKEIEKAVKESIEKYKEMEDGFKDLLSQNEVCDILKKEDKEDLMKILGSLSAVIGNEINLTKLEYIEAELDNPDKLLRDHPYRLAKIENLEKAADFFDNGLEKLGEEEGALLEQFLEWLKEHPELLEAAALIALAAGFAFLAEPAAEAIAATGITLKIAGAVKSAAVMGCLLAGYALIDEKQRDKFMAWITGTGRVPDWAWWGSTHKYEQEKK